MIKRTIALLISLIMTALLFSGCGSAPAETDEKRISRAESEMAACSSGTFSYDFTFAMIIFKGECPDIFSVRCDGYDPAVFVKRNKDIGKNRIKSEFLTYLGQKTYGSGPSEYYFALKWSPSETYEIVFPEAVNVDVVTWVSLRRAGNSLSDFRGSFTLSSSGEVCSMRSETDEFGANVPTSQYTAYGTFPDNDGNELQYSITMRDLAPDTRIDRSSTDFLGITFDRPSQLNFSGFVSDSSGKIIAEPSPELCGLYANGLTFEPGQRYMINYASMIITEDGNVEASSEGVCAKVEQIRSEMEDRAKVNDGHTEDDPGYILTFKGSCPDTITVTHGKNQSRFANGAIVFEEPYTAGLLDYIGRITYDDGSTDHVFTLKFRSHDKYTIRFDSPVDLSLTSWVHFERTNEISMSAGEITVDSFGEGFSFITDDGSPAEHFTRSGIDIAENEREQMKFRFSFSIDGLPCRSCLSSDYANVNTAPFGLGETAPIKIKGQTFDLYGNLMAEISEEDEAFYAGFSFLPADSAFYNIDYQHMTITDDNGYDIRLLNSGHFEKESEFPVGNLNVELQLDKIKAEMKEKSPFGHTTTGDPLILMAFHGHCPESFRVSSASIHSTFSKQDGEITPDSVSGAILRYLGSKTDFGGTYVYYFLLKYSPKGDYFLVFDEPVEVSFLSYPINGETTHSISMTAGMIEVLNFGRDLRFTTADGSDAAEYTSSGTVSQWEQNLSYFLSFTGLPSGTILGPAADNLEFRFLPSRDAVIRVSGNYENIHGDIVQITGTDGSADYFEFEFSDTWYECDFSYGWFESCGIPLSELYPDLF